MSYEIEFFSGGQVSLRDRQAGETMHSMIGPSAESQTLYIQQSQLAERFQKNNLPTLVLYDVGLGIGANALAAIEVFLNHSSRRNFHLVSFENQLGGIQYALKHFRYFPFLEPYEELIHPLLEKKEIQFQSTSGSVLTWTLFEGNFQETVLSAPEPEVIFYDFYSPKANPALWGHSIFRLLFEKTSQRRSLGLETSLYTYCSATAARTALLLAGFYVGQGVSTLGKKDTTVASTSYSTLLKPFHEDWISHLRRSGKPIPADCSDSLEEVIKKIRDQLKPNFSILLG